jgi:hypothetical protein
MEAYRAVRRRVSHITYTHGAEISPTRRPLFIPMYSFLLEA